MHDFRYVGNKLFCEGVAVETLARKFGTPLYVYSQRTLTNIFKSSIRAGTAGSSGLFAMKANSNLAVLRTIACLGGGFDIVSAANCGASSAAATARNVGLPALAKPAEIEFALRKIFIASMPRRAGTAAHQ